MTTPYEHAHLALNALVDWADANTADVQRNEATTRFHLIDQLLAEVLAWPREEIRTEVHSNGEYTDYELGRPHTRLIVEAKREGNYFSIPIGVTSSIQSLESLTKNGISQNFKDAASQVARYCGERGVSMAAVCNGTQLVAFLGARTDGVAPMKGAALVFPSLSAMQENFQLLWENLSYSGVQARRLHVSLREGEKPTAPLPLSSQLSHYPGMKRRNDIQVGLEMMAELYLEDLTRLPEIEEDFIRSTYSTSGALSQYALISKQILESRYSLLHEENPDDVAEAIVSKSGTLSVNLTSDILAAGLSKRPIILLGDVGAGKTMFIRHLVNVDAKEVFKQAIVIYIDYGRNAAMTTDLQDYAIDESAAQLLSEYGIDPYENSFIKAVHNGALNRFDRGVYGDLREVDPVAYMRERISYLASLVENRSAHMQACLQHLRGSMRKQIVIFLDNIDQRSYDDQEKVFLLAESLASNWPATVFVSLRPDTFYRSRSEGTLTAYQPRVFTISPPRVDIVIKNRLKFALNQLEAGGQISEMSNVSLRSESLKLCLEMLLSNFSENQKLIELVDNLSAGNIRRALDFVSSFIGSGHVDTRKILDIYERQGSYAIPLHEFLRATIYGDYEHFEPNASPVLNLFDISQPDGREHFLAAMILHHVHVMGDRPGAQGYLPDDNVYAFAQGMGFDADQISWSVDRLTKKNLLERSPRSRSRASDVAEHLRITTSGAYTAQILIGMFAYLDAVVVDTPIVDATYRKLLTDSRTVAERLRRAEVFRVYLDNQWKLVEAGPIESTFNWREQSGRSRTEIRRIQERQTGSAD